MRINQCPAVSKIINNSKTSACPNEKSQFSFLASKKFSLIGSFIYLTGLSSGLSVDFFLSRLALNVSHTKPSQFLCGSITRCSFFKNHLLDILQFFHPYSITVCQSSCFSYLCDQEFFELFARRIHSSTTEL